MSSKKKTSSGEPVIAGVEIQLGFYRKDNGEWYASVPQHKEYANRMVCGADKLCETIAGGGNSVTAVLSAEEIIKDEHGKPRKPMMELHLMHHDSFGGVYRVVAMQGRNLFDGFFRTLLMKIPFIGESLGNMIWLCNVTHTVFGGGHPSVIYLYDAFPSPANGGNVIYIRPPQQSSNQHGKE